MFILEFVDYKCLESLLIDGEDIIATEGIGGTVKTNFKKFVDYWIKNGVIYLFKWILAIINAMISTFKGYIKDAAVPMGKKCADMYFDNFCDYTKDICNNLEQISLNIIDPNKIDDSRNRLNKVIDLLDSFDKTYDELNNNKNMYYLNGDRIERSMKLLYLKRDIDQHIKTVSKLIQDNYKIDNSINYNESNAVYNDVLKCTSRITTTIDKYAKLLESLPICSHAFREYAKSSISHIL